MNITRSITKNAIKIALAEKTDEGIKLVEKELEVVGDISTEKLEKIVAKEYPKATITDIVTTTEKYEMTVETFIKYATKA